MAVAPPRVSPVFGSSQPIFFHKILISRFSISLAVDNFQECPLEGGEVLLHYFCYVVFPEDLRFAASMFSEIRIETCPSKGCNTGVLISP